MQRIPKILLIKSLKLLNSIAIIDAPLDISTTLETMLNKFNVESS